MAATLRHARRHRGLTGANPSVGTLLVDDNMKMVGRGITARGGRPHAETIAITMAKDRARGTTAYVSLEPCAHHGATPPCAQALIDSGIKRVVTAWTDPDSRVDGKGHQMLSAAGVEVHTGVLANVAASRSIRLPESKIQEPATSDSKACGICRWKTGPPRERNTDHRPPCQSVRAQDAGRSRRHPCWAWHR